jgi:hypothetical protein
MVLRKIRGSRRDDVTRELRIMHNEELLDVTRYYLGGQIKKNEIWWALGTYGREERCIQDFGVEIWEKEKILKPRRKRENNIKKWIFKNWNGEAWTGLIWPRRGTGGGRLRMTSRAFDLHKMRGISCLTKTC